MHRVGRSAGLFAELKRRNVPRAAVLYVGAIWALAQGIAQLAPVFGFGDWVTRWFVAAGAIGFPFWVAFTWFYDFTSEGLKRESELDPADPAAGARGRRLDKWIIAVLVVAVVLLVTNQFVQRRDATSRGAASSGAAGAATAAPIQVSPRSIAVLPFDNLSRDADNAYFARGMHDLILTRLSEIGELKVISRTSTMKYGSRPENLRQVAAELGVATVLEGSVQKSGNDVLINVQLIDAKTDTHIWGESYQRTLDNIFGMEGEVAQKVADALRARLSPAESERIAAIPTHDREAYDLFLRAEFLLDRGVINFDKDSLGQAVALYGQAVARDPEFALAFARKSYAENMLGRIGGEAATEALYAQGHQDAERALVLAPRLPMTQVALGYSAYFGRNDPVAATAAFKLVLDLQPNDLQALEALALIERRSGRIEVALDRLRQALALDPRNVILISTLSETLMMVSDYEGAQTWSRRARMIDPDNADAMAREAMAGVLMNGDAQAALARLEGEAPLVRAMRVYLLYLLHRNDEALAELRSLPSGGFDLYFNRSLLLARLLQLHGDAAGARAGYLQALSEAMPKTRVASPVQSAWAWSNVGGAQIGLGRFREGQDAINRSLALVDPAHDHVDGPRLLYANAGHFAAAGRADLAVPLLARALAAAGVGLTTSPRMLWLDPAWDPIRDSPGFRQLLGKYSRWAPQAVPVSGSGMPG